MIPSRGAEEGSMPERDAAEQGARIQQAASEIAYLHANHDVFRLDLRQPGGIARRVVGLARRLLRRLLTPILARQATYNEVNARAASSVLGVVQGHATALESVRREAREAIDRLARQETIALEALQRAVVDALDELGRKQEDALAGLPEAVLARVESRVRDLERAVLRQRARRGGGEEIGQRLEAYLPLLKDCAPCAEGRPVVDVGCGRGEWLELLREHGVAARGVDLDRAAVRRCRGLGLDVVESDAITFLRGLPDGAIGALTALHVIEHLPVEGRLDLLHQGVRVLAPGGVAIFETPDPEIVMAASGGSLLRLLADAKGLSRLEIRTLDSPEAPRDYALVAWKA
jgi:SAM-dependent methyltransferase